MNAYPGNPNHTGRRGSTAEQQRARYWPTAKAYKALGKVPPLEVIDTDRALGLETK